MSTIREIIKPEHVNTDTAHWFKTTLRYDQEKTAMWIVRFLKVRDAHEGAGWSPFRDEEMQAFYRKATKDPEVRFAYNGLAMNGLLSISDGTVTIVDGFIRTVAGQIR